MMKKTWQKSRDIKHGKENLLWVVFEDFALNAQANFNIILWNLVESQERGDKACQSCGTSRSEYIWLERRCY